jgi:hypothetical protein
MVIPAPDSQPLEVRGADGQVIAYLVPAEQMAQLRGQIDSLREQLAAAVQQRDHHRAKREELLKTHCLPVPTEEELLAAVPNSHEIAKLIAELESR